MDPISDMGLSLRSIIDNSTEDKIEDMNGFSQNFWSSGYWIFVATGSHIQMQMEEFFYRIQSC